MTGQSPIKSAIRLIQRTVSDGIVALRRPISVHARAENSRLKERLGWDGDWYIGRYPDIAEAVARKIIADPFHHFLQFGYKEGRFPSAAAETRGCHSIVRGVLQDGDFPPDVNVGGFEINVGGSMIPLNWPVKGEVSKTFLPRLVNGFFQKYMSGPVILDVGYKGGHADSVPIFPHAIGIDLDHPGYDGVHLPFSEESVDTVFASHMLEHVSDHNTFIREWFRVIKIGGFIVCIVPHQFLYERRINPPSKWSSEHKRFYTPAALLREFEESLAPNTYRIRHLADNDFGYAYELISPDRHAIGCYEIELVVEKIKAPSWNLA